MELAIDGIEVRVHDTGGGDPTLPVVCAMHASESFGLDTAGLLASTSGARVVCVAWAGPHALARIESLDDVVRVLEGVRRTLALPRWCFWGMSGGGWIAQAYAVREPAALAGIVVESACACFRARLADPAWLISPAHPMWRALIDGVASTPELGVVDRPGGAVVFTDATGPVLVSPAPLDAAMRAAMRWMLAIDLRASLPSIGTPTLVVAGEADPICPIAHTRAVADAIPGAAWRPIAGAGHVPTAARHPEVATAIRAWLPRLG